jgi:hypothetical protein
MPAVILFITLPEKNDNLDPGKRKIGRTVHRRRDC